MIFLLGFLFFVLMIIVLLICYLLFTIIIYCVVQCCFWPFVCCRLGSLFLSHSLYIHIFAYFIVMKNQTHGLWLEAVAWTRRHCHYFVLFFHYFSILSVKYLTYLTGFYCPVDSVSLRTTLM